MSSAVEQRVHLRALAHPLRLRMLALPAAGPLSAAQPPRSGGTVRTSTTVALVGMRP